MVPPAAVLLAVVLLGAASPARAAEETPPLNPHTREACLHCHKGKGGKDLGPNRTTIFPSQEEPHAVLSGSCRSCHKEDRQGFWLLILPTRGEKGPAPSASGSSIPPSAVTPQGTDAPGAGILPGEGEGFDNSHDRMDCAGCHGKPAGELKKGAATPPKFASGGADAFCRACHSGVDRSHFPRGNQPRPGATCTNCHKAHGKTLLFPALRDDYPQFVSDSTLVNPHGGKIFCLACHQDTPQEGQPPSLRFPEGASQLCRRCHPGTEHHPLGVRSSQATWKMDFSKLPLERETVACTTCHQPPECRGAAGAENRRFLRGGPYESIQEFCARCHEGQKFSALNPHDLIDAEGNVKERKCHYCHATVPSLTGPPGVLEYTDSFQSLCMACHPQAPHPGVDHHVAMPPAMTANLAKYAEKRLVDLPMERGMVTCVTCHNPHEKGLLKGAAGVGADEDKRLRLTTYNEQCTPCHGRH